MSWTDRVVEYPNRVKLTAVSGQDNTFDMEAAEGTVYVEGTLLNAENLNNETNELIENAITSVVTRTLLWTNPSPTQAFSAQNINVPDMSQYDYFEVEMRQDTTHNSCWIQSIGNDSYGVINAPISIMNAYIYFFGREFTTRPTENRIAIGAGYEHASNATASTGRNTAAIPTRIWGIKTI